MEQPTRKASDVLLELEAKIDKLTSAVSSLNFTNSILSNKLNSLMEKLSTLNAPNSLPVRKPSVEPIILQDPNKQLEVSADFNLQMDKSPVGFRKVSRPETYAGDNSYLNAQNKVNIFSEKKNALKDEPATIHVDHKAFEKEPPPSKIRNSNSTNSIPVQQRIVDKSGKSVFLADVEIINLDTSDAIPKIRTNGTGKWMAPLAAGNYHVIITKKSLTGGIVKSEQNIKVDGSSSPLDLPVLIIDAK